MNYSIQYAGREMYGAGNVFSDGRGFETYSEAQNALENLHPVEYLQVWPIAVDPAGCGCTECLIGQYIPLDQADPQHIVDMLFDEIADHTGGPTEIEIIVSVGTQVFTLPPAVGQRLLEDQL